MNKVWILVALIAVLGTAGVIWNNSEERRASRWGVRGTPAFVRLDKTTKAIHLYMEDSGRGFPLKANWQAAVQPYANFPVGESAQPNGGKIEFNPRLSGVRWSAVYRAESFPMLRDLNNPVGEPPQLYCTAASWIRIVTHKARFEAFNKAWQANPLDEVRFSGSNPTVIPYVPAPTNPTR